MRRFELYAVLVLTGLLIVLSIVGAFINVKGASAMFNSWPVVAFWVAFVLLLIAGLLTFKRLVRSPGRLAMHLGVLLILAGAMWGSSRGHNLARRLLGAKKVRTGYMRIVEGKSTNRVFADQTFQKDGVIALLPFSLFLKDFRLEYYEVKGQQWDVFVVAPPTGEKGEDDDGHGHENEPRQRKVKWALGQEVEIPFTEARLKVLKYLDKARPVYPEGGEVGMEIIGSGGKRITVPAKVGQEATIASPQVTVRILEVFANLKVYGSGEDRKTVDVGGLPVNPALKVAVTWPSGVKQIRYVMALLPMHGQQDDGLQLHYLFPEAIGAEADPTSDTPAMQVLLTYQGREQREWFIPRSADRYVWTSLASVLGKPDPLAGDHDKSAHGITSPRLYLARPMQGIRDYLSDLTVLDEGQPVASKTVEVNDPLHYGGYHFYQHSYDSAGGQYTVLSVSSDSGLLTVYAGFILLVAGAFWQYWIVSAWSYVAGRRAHGS
ncbi:MAG: hypothetical protein GWP05_10095 [Anaerolineaceae bacterium]|nr:hypothetical protein [Anaerolineaceae bacterium]